MVDIRHFKWPACFIWGRLYASRKVIRTDVLVNSCHKNISILQIRDSNLHWRELSYAVISSDQFGCRITIMLFQELLHKQKITRTPSAEDVKRYFVVLYLFNFIVKITQKCNKARSELRARLFTQEKSFVSDPHFQKRYQRTTIH